MNPSADEPTGKVELANKLPLGWTKVQRKRRASDHDESPDAVGADECCDDPFCIQRVPKKKAALSGGVSNVLNTSDDMQEDDGRTSNVMEGTAVICLPDIHPSWFQGYLQLKGIPKPWGLLGEQQVLDECLQCSDGGYRLVRLTLFPFNENKNGDQTIVLNDIEWRGGDMMQLEGEELSLKPDRMWTGSKTLPFLEKYFESLVNQLRDRVADRRSDILELLPHVAIVTGSIVLRLPQSAISRFTEDGCIFRKF